MSNIIPMHFEGLPIRFDMDGWLNATDIAKAFDTRASEWIRKPDTVEYMVKRGRLLGLNCVTMTQLSVINDLQSSSSASKSRMMALAKRSGMMRVAPGRHGGTWLHPKLAVKFARWLSVDFEIWCDEQIELILSTGPSLRQQLDNAILAAEQQREKGSDAGRELARHRWEMPKRDHAVESLIDQMQFKLEVAA